MAQKSSCTPHEKGFVLLGVILQMRLRQPLDILVLEKNICVGVKWAK